jgi:hypothetical protein
MKIYIPTRGRSNKQILWDALPSSVKQNIEFVVNDMSDAPADAAGAHLVPKWVKNIGDKRHFIVHTLHNIEKDGPFIVMCDDDLRLARRRFDNPNKFHRMERQDYVDFFAAIEQHLREYAQVTVMAREGGNRTHGNVICGRAMRVLGYNVAQLRAHKIDFTRVPTKEDFDATLQLLRLGYPNLVVGSFVQDDGGGSNAAGGCSIYRDHAYMEARALELAALHPGFVKVVKKATKGAWGGGERIDVQVQWKQAYQSSRRPYHAR